MKRLTQEEILQFESNTAYTARLQEERKKVGPLELEEGRKRLERESKQQQSLLGQLGDLQ